MRTTALRPMVPVMPMGMTKTDTEDSAPHQASGAQSTQDDNQRISGWQQQLHQQAQRDPAGFRMTLRAAFGDKADLVQIDQLLDRALADELPKPLISQLVAAGTLGPGFSQGHDSGSGAAIHLDNSFLPDDEISPSGLHERTGQLLSDLPGDAGSASVEGAVLSSTLENKAASGDHDTSRDIDALGYMATALGAQGALAENTATAAIKAGLPNDIINMAKRVGGISRSAGWVATAADPLVSGWQGYKRADNEGANQGEKINQGVRDALKRVDNVAVTVGMTVGVAVAGTLFLGTVPLIPIAAVVVGFAAGYIYNDNLKHVDNAFGAKVDNLMDAVEASSSTNTQSYNRPSDQLPERGWSALNRAR